MATTTAPSLKTESGTYNVIGIIEIKRQDDEKENGMVIPRILEN
jgi:hypothetical protein